MREFVGTQITQIVGVNQRLGVQLRTEKGEASMSLCNG
jgi:hypothetical protein